MSSGCGDVLSLADLQTAKKHQIFEAEVITGKSGGVATGENIDYATNPVTLQVQKTMPAILRDIGFEPASFDFTTGGTLTVNDRNKAVLWTLASGGDGDWYYWEGALPKVIPAASTPASAGGVADGAWRPVGDITLRSEISDPDGATLYPELQIARWRDVGDVRGWGAAGDGVTDDTAAINAAALAVSNRGGGEVVFPAGKFIVSSPILIYSKTHYRGAGRGATRVTASPGSNTDVFKTWNFDTMTGAGNTNEAPYGFSVKYMTVTGNYLKLDEGGLVDDEDISWRVADEVLNTSGSAFKIFGSGYDIDVEVYNVAENALYGEAIGDNFENKEYATRIRITGRISGKEAVVWRGPSDIYFEYIIFGLAGLLPYTSRLTATTNTSTIYPSMPVHGVVLDNNRPYAGHVEIGLVHIYAVGYGYGLYTLGVNRFNATHAISENNLGGYYFGNGAHGVISSLESRANGRYPDSYSGSSITNLPDIVVDNGTIWQLTGIMRVYRYAPSADLADYAIQIKGNTNNLTITYAAQLQSDAIPLDAGFLSVTGNYNRISFQALRVKGNGVYVTGAGNMINGALQGLYSGTLLHRNGSAAYANIFDITGSGLTADSTGFNSSGTPASENIRLVASGTTGWTPFTGDAMAATNRTQVWEISCTTGNSINGKSTEDYTELPVPSSALSGTFTVDHNFLYAPNRAQVKLGLNFPGTAPNTIVQLGVVGTPTSTQVVIGYLWSALPSSGAANVQVHIK